MLSLETQTASISFLDKNILLIKMKEGAEIDVEEATENFEAVLKLAEGRKYAVLVDACVPVQVTPDARMYGANIERQRDLIAQAIVVNTLANRLIGNFIINFNKPFAPTKLFSDNETALVWLNEQVVKNVTSVSSSQSKSE